MLETASCEINGFRSGLMLSNGRVKLWNKAAHSDWDIPIEEISAVTQKPSGLTRGYLHLSVFNGTLPPKSTTKAMTDPYVVALAMGASANDSAREFGALVGDYLSRCPAASREPSPVAGSTPGSTDITEAAMSMRGLEVLGRKARRLYDAQIGDPHVRFVIAGLSDQCLVALDDRCIIVKPGFMAGATGGGRVTTFQYSDVTGIEVNTGWTTGVLEVLTPSYQGVGQRDYWSSQKNESPYQVSNCLPLNKTLLAQSAPLIEELRRSVSAAKDRNHPSPQSPQARDLPAQLRELSALRDGGVLSDAEFEQAKARLLSP